MAKILTTDAIAPIKGYIDGKVGDLAEIVEGKCNTYVLSYSDTISAIESFIEMEEYESDFVCDAEGNDITSSISDYESVSVMNSGFNTNLASIGSQTDPYVILRNVPTTLPQASGRFEYVLAKLSELNLKIGDVFLVIETDVPDRWFAKDGNVFRFYKMETAKVDLSDVVKLTGAQTITGAKTFTSDVLIQDTSAGQSPEFQFKNNVHTSKMRLNSYAMDINTHWNPRNNNSYDLGNSSTAWRDSYFNGKLHLISETNNDYNLYGDGAWLTLKRSTTGIMQFYDTIVKPYTDNTVDLGTSGQKWKDLYLAGKIDLGTKVEGRTNTCKIELDAYDGVGIYSNNVRPINIYDTAIYVTKPLYVTDTIKMRSSDNTDQWEMKASTNGNLTMRRANTDIFSFRTNDFIPNSNNSKNLGASGLAFKDLYLSGDVHLKNGVSVYTDNSGADALSFTVSPWYINAYNIQPIVDNASSANYLLGSSSRRWGTIYAVDENVSGNLNFYDSVNSRTFKMEMNTTYSRLNFINGYNSLVGYIPYDGGFTFTEPTVFNAYAYLGNASFSGNITLVGNLTDGTNSISVANIPSKATTAVGQYTFADGFFLMPKSLLTQGLYVFTYGNCSAFVLIMDTMWAYAHTSPIRVAMPVIYDTDGNSRPGVLGLHRLDGDGNPSATGDYVGVALFDSQGNPVENDYQMTIIRTGML